MISVLNLLLAANSLLQLMGFLQPVPQTYDRAHFSYDIVRREGDSEPPDYIENVFQLYKLHGSIDWCWTGSLIVRSSEVSSGDPVLIYPRDSKFQEVFENPFLDLIGSFHLCRERQTRPSSLLVSDLTMSI